MPHRVPSFRAAHSSPRDALGALLATLLLALLSLSCAAEDLSGSRYPGYQGIWFTLGQQGEHGDKYSGGLGTYTAKHKPLAVYSADVNKTFFVYGGTKHGTRHLLIMAGCYDHQAGTVERPLVVHDKLGVDDPHDNASLAMDAAGHLWVFVSGRGRSRPGFKYRADAPHSIASFTKLSEEEMTYPQPWHVAGKGFFYFLTKYTAGRELYFETSADGYEWTPKQKLAGMGGHYQVSGAGQGLVFTAFNRHPGGNVDKRTDLYYVQSADFGKTWTTVDGEQVGLPLTETDTAARVRDFESEGRLVYMKDIRLDGQGRPAILTVASSHHMPGPKGGPRVWTLARWDGSAWRFIEIAESTHNYDMGSLYAEEGGLWRIIAPTEAGPQALGTGGEVVMWTSEDGGWPWVSERQLTAGSSLNHMYVRRPLLAHPEFYAFWADGNPNAMSPSRLYFATREGRVFQLPYEMAADSAPPVPIHNLHQTSE